MSMHFNPKEVAQAIEALPGAPSPSVSDRYAFIDTKQVVKDMQDVGFVPVSLRRPASRTKAGVFALHEVEFRRPQDVAPPVAKEVPRIVFLNSYDGSRRAQFLSGVFRVICSNGLVVGTTFQNSKFLHLGEYEQEFHESLRAVGESSNRAFDRLDRFQSIQLDEEQRLRLAQEAVRIRMGADDGLVLDPKTALLPRRREDVKRDLWTSWNILQENLIKGGLPARSSSGIRTTRGLQQIQRSLEVNQGLWDLLEQTADELA